MESDSFLCEKFNNEENGNEIIVENLRRSLDIQGDKLNQITMNNRELLNVQSQLARLRSELEKSEMLRQTLEYELTLLRTQHGKQNAFTHQLQNQFHQANEQIKELQSQISIYDQEKDKEIKEKDQRIKELENESETLHDRERRIEALNEQIQKMEKTFYDSESLSRKNLAQSILAKEKEAELTKKYELIQIKLQYNEQTLEQEREISNEAKLNVQLLSTRLTDLEKLCEKLKNENENKEKKLNEYEKQNSNEKILRTTLSKIQLEFERKCAETLQSTNDYEKQLKHLRDELTNYRRKYRNNEDKYSQLVTKTFDLLRLTRIINENQSIDLNLPTLKQLEELKFHFEQLKTNKIDSTNEINRLKKTIERLNKSSQTFKQNEHQKEMNQEKFQIEIDEYQEKLLKYEETLIRLKNHREELIKENDKKSSIINLIDLKLKNLLGKSSLNIEKDFQDLQNQFEKNLFQLKSFQELIQQKDKEIIQLKDKFTNDLFHLNSQFEQKQKEFFQEKNQILQIHQNQILNLNQQFQKMEIRSNEIENELINEKKSFIEENDKNILIIKYLFSLWIGISQRYFQLIYSKNILFKQFQKYNQIKEILSKNSLSKNRFRIFVYSIIAFHKFLSFKTNLSLKTFSSSNYIYHQQTFLTINQTFIQNISSKQIFQSLINHFHLQIQKRSFIPYLSKSSSSIKTIDQIHSLIVRINQLELKCDEKEKELIKMEKVLKNVENEIECRIEYEQFQRICDELQRALDREKQGQLLLNEQNQQLKSLTDIIQQTQNDKDFIQNKFNQIKQNEKYSQEKIQQLNKTHQQMDENVKRAEKAIRLVVSDKEQISSFCNQINSILNLNDKQQKFENIEQLIEELNQFIQLSNNFQDKKFPPEFLLCQTMTKGFIHLLNHLKDLLKLNRKDIQSLKEHCQILTEQFRQNSFEDHSIQNDSSQTILVQAHPIQIQVNHHPQSAFKPIKPQLDN